jgi:hypothetical protein
LSVRQTLIRRAPFCPGSVLIKSSQFTGGPHYL